MVLSISNIYNVSYAWLNMVRSKGGDIRCSTSSFVLLSLRFHSIGSYITGLVQTLDQKGICTGTRLVELDHGQVEREKEVK